MFDCLPLTKWPRPFLAFLVLSFLHDFVLNNFLLICKVPSLLRVPFPFCCPCACFSERPSSPPLSTFKAIEGRELLQNVLAILGEELVERPARVEICVSD